MWIVLKMLFKKKSEIVETGLEMVNEMVEIIFKNENKNQIHLFHGQIDKKTFSKPNLNKSPWGKKGCKKWHKFSFGKEVGDFHSLKNLRKYSSKLTSSALNSPRFPRNPRNLNFGNPGSGNSNSGTLIS
jgi:hypothetical protein